MMMTQTRLRSRRTLSLILALLLCVSVLAVPTAASDIADRFDETDWHLGLNDRGTTYSLLFHRNGTFSYFGWKGLDHGTGEWKYSDGLLWLNLGSISSTGLGWESYKPDGDSFYGKTYTTDTGTFTPSLTPASTSTYSELYNKWYNDIRVDVGRKTVTWTDAKPYINAQNRVMVPLRATAEAMGLDVSWDSQTKTAVFTGIRRLEYYTEYELKVYFPAGSKYAKVEYRLAGSSGLICEKTVKMDTSAVNLNGRVYAPVRYLVEAFGCTVEWNNSTRCVYVSDDGCIDVPAPVPIRKLTDGKYTVRIFEGGLSNVSGGVGAYAEVLENRGTDEYGHIKYETVDVAVLVFTDKTDIIVDSYHDWAYDFSPSSERYVHFSDIWEFFERVYCSSEIVTIEIKDGELVSVNIYYHS